MNILSVCDGISCGQVAFERSNIKVDKYYASEIDNFAIQITQKNYPNTIQVGDITKWREWDIDWNSIDILIGGTPCQGFTFAGKQLNFEDPRSKLFFDYVDILNHLKSINPNIIFLLENVKMSKENQDIITSFVGVEPIKINSNLVSAQNRQRLYWTNIPNIQLPQDKGTILKDIIRTEDNNLYHLSKKHHSGFLKSYNWKHSELNGKAKPILASYYKQPPHCPYIPCEESESGFRMLSPIEAERCQTLPDNYTDGISKTQRFKCIGNGWTVDIISHILNYIK
jgi:site-specific DNA-cytosine methylase